MITVHTPTSPVPTADDIVRQLDLRPHPEGGHFRETFRDSPADGDRSASTAIYYLLRAGEVSHWHHVDAVEVWHWYAGAPLELSVSDGENAASTSVLGMALTAGQRPQAVVPAYHWQSARSLGAWTLVGCTVAPGFEFAGFEVAPAGWAPTTVPPDASQDGDA
jgi:uncharacterized protein